jgi:hypothetical protein
MKKAQANVQPMSGEEMQRYVADAYALPEPLIKRVRAILSQ